MRPMTLVFLVCFTAWCLVPARPACAQRRGGMGRAGSVRYAASMAALASHDDDEPWNAGFDRPAPSSDRQVATVNSSAGVRSVGSALNRINYGSIPDAGAPMSAASGGNPVWDLVRMSDYLEQQEQLTLSMSMTYERVTGSGQKIQLSSRQVTYVQRPDKLAVQIKSDRSLTQIVYDGGDTATLVDQTRNLYATIPVQGSVEAVLGVLAGEYGIAVPANDLLCKGAYARIKERIVLAKELGQETIEGRSYSHSLFSNNDVDLQIWVESRENPVPRRIVIVYKNAPGRPRCRMDITRLETSPIPESAFKIDVPAGAQQVTIAPR